MNTIISYFNIKDENIKNINNNTLHSEIINFLNKNNLKIRMSSHIRQLSPQNEIDFIYSFLYKTIKERRFLGIGDNELGRIFNCDKTAIYFENPAIKTIDIKGNK